MKTTIVLLSIFLLTVVSGYAQQKRYPYVQDGKIIVCREGTDGVISSLIHPNWTTTPSHDETDAANNRFAARFEVSASFFSEPTGKTQNWEDVKSKCASYSESSGDAGTWRLPTIRELRLIYVLRDELTSVNFSINTYNQFDCWSATEDSSSSDKVWVVSVLHEMSISSYFKQHVAASYAFAYCVRDL